MDQRERVGKSVRYMMLFDVNLGHLTRTLGIWCRHEAYGVSLKPMLKICANVLWNVQLPKNID